MTHIGGVELLGRTLVNILVFAHGPQTRWTPAHGIRLRDAKSWLAGLLREFEAFKI